MHVLAAHPGPAPLPLLGAAALDHDHRRRDSIQQLLGRGPTMDDVLLQIHEGFRLAEELMAELPATQNDPAYLAERCHGIVQAYAAAIRLVHQHHGSADTPLPSPPPLGGGTAEGGNLQQLDLLRPLLGGAAPSSAPFPHHQHHMIGRLLEASPFNNMPADAFGSGTSFVRPVRRQQASSSRSSPPVQPRQHRRRTRESGERMMILVPVQRTGNTDLPPDDGYTWRKYGQKDILGSRYPRSYYRCTHKNYYGCEAKKKVQRLDDDPFMYEVTYCGNHTCLTSTTPLLTLPASAAATSTTTSNRLTSSPTGSSAAAAILAGQDVVMAAAEHPARALSTAIQLGISWMPSGLVGPSATAGEGSSAQVVNVPAASSGRDAEYPVMDFADAMFNSGSSGGSSMDAIFPAAHHDRRDS
ncbi:hypothetical protein BS78_K309800 [Paspalum vaginatum]|uniref:WRKY domain-containing protein n=1 Tax=Paspalum vaginatum TaxID=158149 RepID=A0A9W7XAB3_9POAL|nr:hypothetical protein BS78_K110200 [Paspalum vaginatum]KAJ1254902.1 hypothetical protein BS78_K309800 [Paspalum vaginatum]